MLNLIRSLYAAHYSGRVSLNLGPDHGLIDASIFPGVRPLVRMARINGLTAEQCAQFLRGAVSGVDRLPSSAESRTHAINAAFVGLAQDDALWKMIEQRRGTPLQH